MPKYAPVIWGVALMRGQDHASYTNESDIPPGFLINLAEGFCSLAKGPVGLAGRNPKHDKGRKGCGKGDSPGNSHCRLGDGRAQGLCPARHLASGPCIWLRCGFLVRGQGLLSPPPHDTLDTWGFLTNQLREAVQFWPLRIKPRCPGDYLRLHPQWLSAALVFRSRWGDRPVPVHALEAAGSPIPAR